MNCDQHKSLLDDYLDASLDPETHARFEAHAAGCSDCRQAVAAAEQLQQALAAYPVEGPSAGFAARAFANAAKTRSRPPRIVAAGFVAAFTLSVLTLIYTGLMVREPSPALTEALPTVSMTLDERRTVNLVFASETALENVSLLVDLPSGVELAGYEGRRQIRWNTRLQAGKNVLPLELLAIAGMGGQLTARLQHGDKEKVFRVNVSVIGG